MRLAESGKILSVSVGYATNEGVHVEAINETGFLPFGACGSEEFAVGMEEAGKEARECCDYFVRVEGGWADEMDVLGAVAVGVSVTS